MAWVIEEGEIAVLAHHLIEDVYKEKDGTIIEPSNALPEDFLPLGKDV
jgi:hypothetical protein